MQKIPVTFIFSLFTFAILAQEYKSIAVQGFNRDVVAEENGHDALSTTTTRLDSILQSNFVLFSESFARAAGMPQGNGLPDHGKLVTTWGAFQLNRFDQKNALYIIKGQQGELTLARPEKLTQISLLGFATEGNAQLSVIVMYTDGSSVIYTQQSYPDWFNGPNAVIRGYGRVKREKHSLSEDPLYYEGHPDNPRMYTIDLGINDTKVLSSILIRNVSLGGNTSSNRVVVMALSGYYRPDTTAMAPEVVSLPGFELYGTVADAATHKLIPATIRFTSATASRSVETAGGRYHVSLDGGVDYDVKIYCPDYIDKLDKLSLKNDGPADREINFVLQPLEVGSTVNLKSVLFFQSTATLLEESYAELNFVADFLHANPSIQIELAGHTDNRGTASANLELSRRRVDAIKKYLVSKGIDAIRIKGKGYGSVKPVASNATEETRKLNRRVEFVILKK